MDVTSASAGHSRHADRLELPGGRRVFFAPLPRSLGDPLSPRRWPRPDPAPHCPAYGIHHRASFRNSSARFDSDDEKTRFIARVQAGIKMPRYVCLDSTQVDASRGHSYHASKTIPLSRTRSNTSIQGLWRLFRRHCEPCPRKPEPHRRSPTASGELHPIHSAHRSAGV